MTDLEKAISLIRKLLAKAASTAKLGNAEEAAAFAAKATELLQQHKLEMSEIEMDAEGGAEEPFGQQYEDLGGLAGRPITNNRSGWMTRLGNAIARANFCRMVVFPGTKRVVFLGRAVDRQLTIYLYTVLSRNGYRLAVEHSAAVCKAAKARGESPPPSPKAAFLDGYSIIIVRRLHALRSQATTAGGSVALVRFSAADKAVEKFMNDTMKTKNYNSPVKARDEASFKAGAKAGEAANLNPGIGGGAKSTAASLAAGQKLLGGGK